MRNKTAFIIFIILIGFLVFAACLHMHYEGKSDLGIFIVTAMAALGTCGVTILNVFPYIPKDRLKAVICWRKKQMFIMIENKSNHTIYLGTDKYPVAEHEDAYALWWPDNDKNCDSYNSNHICTNPGDNVAIPSRVTVGYPVDPKIFGKNDLSKLKIKICTSSGYRIDVKNNLIKK